MTLTRVDKVRRIPPRQKAFAEAYCSNGFNAAAAARSVGYSPKVARQVGHRLVREEPVLKLIRQSLDERGLTRERALSELAIIAFASLGELEPLVSGQMTLAEAQAAGLPVGAVKRFTARRRRTADGVAYDDVTLELHQKPEALDKLAKVLGLYDQNVQVNFITPEALLRDIERLQYCLDHDLPAPPDMSFENDPY